MPQHLSQPDSDDDDATALLSTILAAITFLAATSRASRSSEQPTKYRWLVSILAGLQLIVSLSMLQDIMPALELLLLCAVAWICKMTWSHRSRLAKAARLAMDSLTQADEHHKQPTQKPVPTTPEVSPVATSPDQCFPSTPPERHAAQQEGTGTPPSQESQGTQGANNAWREAITELQEMGFNADAAAKALSSNGGKLKAAICTLVQQERASTQELANDVEVA